MESKLFEIEGTLYKVDKKTHISHVFFLEKDIDVLKINLEYENGLINDEEEEKRIILDTMDEYYGGEHTKEYLEMVKENWQKFKNVKSLITLSVDDKNGFRGAGHRVNLAEKVVITKHHASDGYIKGVIPRGNVTITMSIHSITKPIKYHLLVVGGDENA